jgi:hypothetical protein
MKEKYFVELYYYKKNIKESGLQENPNLDNYLPETTMAQVIATSWEEAKNKILQKYPNTAYIYVHETRNIEI